MSPLCIGVFLVEYLLFVSMHCVSVCPMFCGYFLRVWVCWFIPASSMYRCVSLLETSIECMVLLTYCGKLNGCCFVYGVQHLEGCLNPNVAFLPITVSSKHVKCALCIVCSI